jgi:hypothetical protein
MANLNERGKTARRYAAEMRASCEREWTMDEIDAEIAAARRERRERENTGA